MAYDDTKWGGFAKIIVDTSTMTVGDTVRVKSVTTGTNYDKQVVTVGTPLIWETDIYKDYVKICMVQTINDTPTEIGGVYREVDYGQTIYTNVADKTSLQGIQSILNSHTENDVLNIGDEVTISVNLGGTPTDWTMLVGHIDSANHNVDFVSKYLSPNYYDTNASYPNRTTLQNELTSFYTNMSEKDKKYIKDKTCYYQESGLRTITQKIWIPSRNEVFGDLPSENNYQLAIFTTQASRMKAIQGGEAQYWQLTSRNTQVNGVTDDVTATGTLSYSNSPLYSVFCFRLMADS